MLVKLGIISPIFGVKIKNIWVATTQSSSSSSSSNKDLWADDRSESSAEVLDATGAISSHRKKKKTGGVPLREKNGLLRMLNGISRPWDVFEIAECSCLIELLSWGVALKLYWNARQWHLQVLFPAILWWAQGFWPMFFSDLCWLLTSEKNIETGSHPDLGRALELLVFCSTCSQAKSLVVGRVRGCWQPPSLHPSLPKVVGVKILSIFWNSCLFSKNPTTCHPPKVPIMKLPMKMQKKIAMIVPGCHNWPPSWGALPVIRLIFGPWKVRKPESLEIKTAGLSFSSNFSLFEVLRYPS